MSSPNFSDEPGPHGAAPAPAASGRRGTVMKAVAAAVAIVALVFGANAISSGGSSSTASASGAATGQAPPGARGGFAGRMPPGGMGTDVTGATLAKLKAVVTARYPGTIEHALALSDGSYVVHVIRSNGTEVHVAMSKAFKITGTQTGGPPGGARPGGAPPTGTGAPPAGGTPPSSAGGSSSGSSGGSSSSATTTKS
jgi:hypothetical protein